MRRRNVPSASAAGGGDVVDNDDDDDDVMAGRVSLSDAVDLVPPSVTDYMELWVGMASWMFLMYGALCLSTFRSRMFGLPMAMFVSTTVPSVLVGVVYTVESLRYSHALERRQRQQQRASASGSKA